MWYICRVDGSEGDQVNIKDLEGYEIDYSDESGLYASSESTSGTHLMVIW